MLLNIPIGTRDGWNDKSKIGIVMICDSIYCTRQVVDKIRLVFHFKSCNLIFLLDSFPRRTQN